MALAEFREKLPHGLPGWTINSFVFGGHEGAIEWAVDRRAASHPYRTVDEARRFRAALVSVDAVPPWAPPAWTGHYHVTLLPDAALVGLLVDGEPIACMRV